MRAALIRRVFWSLVALAAVAGLLYSLRPQPIEVDIAEVTRGPLAVSVNDDGVTRIRERYVVSTPLAGRLLRVTYDVGDSVVAGQTVLARMQPTDPSLLDPRAVAQAEARVKAAERGLQAAKAELAKAEAAVDYAEQELGRLRKLQPSAAISETELQQAEFAYRARSEEARAAAFQVDIARYELELQQAALLLTASEASAAANREPDAATGETPPNEASPAEEASPVEEASPAEQAASISAQRGETQLRILAPITGRVLRLYQESSAVLTAGSPLMELGDPADLEIVVDALSQDAVRIEAGDPVLLENWGGDQPLRGRVRRVEPSGFTKVSALGVEEQRVNVIIDLLESDRRQGLLGDGFRVDARIVIWQDDNVLRVPASALFRVAGRWHVFRVVDGTAQRTPVEIGRNNGLQAQVLEGLAEGDRVIMHPGDAVQEGSKVAPRPDAEPPAAGDAARS